MQKRTIQTITVAAVVFLILLLVALMINTVQLSAQRRRIRELAALEAQAAAHLQALHEEVELYGSDHFIEYYAYSYLNMQPVGAETFKAKEG